MEKNNKVHKKNEVVKALLKLNKVYGAADDEVKENINFYLSYFAELNKMKNEKLELEEELNIMDGYLEETLIRIDMHMPTNQTA